jgi:hypothetical protein
MSGLRGMAVYAVPTGSLCRAGGLRMQSAGRVGDGAGQAGEEAVDGGCGAPA